MAPSSNRRPGSSRKAQYSTFLGYVIAFAGAILGAILLVFSTGNAGAFAGARTGATDAVVPVGQATAAGRSQGQTVWSALKGYFTYGVRVSQTERELAEARVRLAEMDALREENRKLKALSGLTASEPRPVVTARLIGSTASSTRRFGTIDAGSGDGVVVGMPVRSPDGLVGRVLEVGQRSARVLLITDPESVVPVRRSRDSLPAFASGRGDGTLLIRLITLGVNPLRVGDAFVTSGSGGLYWPNTAMVVVTRLTRDGAIARPLSDPGGTEFVVVQPLWEEAAAIAPSPAASAEPGGTPG